MFASEVYFSHFHMQTLLYWAMAVGLNIRLAFGRFGVRFQPRHTQVVKTGSYSSTAKCSATDVSVTDPWRLTL